MYDGESNEEGHLVHHLQQHVVAEELLILVQSLHEEAVQSPQRSEALDEHDGAGSVLGRHGPDHEEAGDRRRA
eukprot:761909-Hanusia_phi.AAC.3